MPYADEEDDEQEQPGHAMNPKVLIPHDRSSRALDLVSRLFKDRIVWLGDAIDNTIANSLCQQLVALQLDHATAPITLYINSPGGSIIDGMAIYDCIRRSTCPVHAVVCGMAASMGAVILSGCTKGERAALAHAEVLLHQPLGGARGQATDIEISAKRILKSKEMLLRLLAENCGQPIEKVAEDCDRDYWLDAAEAKAYGIVDKLI
jgi:ATP-dependent Clp protease protease subunit